MPKNTKWSVLVPEGLARELEAYIGREVFKTKSEFVRTAVRERLEEDSRKFCEVSKSMRRVPGTRQSKRMQISSEMK